MASLNADPEYRARPERRDQELLEREMFFFSERRRLS
jgi:hypothetical protein